MACDDKNIMETTQETSEGDNNKAGPSGTKNEDKDKENEDKGKEKVDIEIEKEKKEKENEKDNDSDSDDDDRPQIFLRDFSEIIDSDEDEVQSTLISSEVPLLPPPPPDVKRPAKYKKNCSLRKKATQRLAKISTTDDTSADLELTVEYETNESESRVQKKINREEPISLAKLTEWLRRAAKKAYEVSEHVATSASSSPVGLPSASKDTANRKSTSILKDPSSTNTNYEQQQHQYQSASQLYYGSVSAQPSRPRQPVSSIALTSGSESTLIAQPVSSFQNTIWQPPGQVQGMNTSITPIIQQPNTIQQQRLLPTPNQAARIQNGIIMRPTDSSFGQAGRQVVGNRNVVDISVTPQSSTPLIFQLQQRHTEPVRPVTSVQNQRPTIITYTIRPPAPVNQQHPRQNLTVAQQLQQKRTRNVPPPPPPLPPRGPQSVRYPSMKQSAPQVPRPVVSSVAPKQLARPIRPNIMQRINVSPVPQPIKTIGPTPPVQQGGVTAGNQKPIPGSVEELGNDSMHNKTFPSLVVQVKMCLSTKPNRQAQTKSRSDLDANVKAALVHSPSKFTEWLMRRGLLRLEHSCKVHLNQPFKLGMYSELSRQPFSGGYVWAADCCPDKNISVFSGSIFEGSKYPPGTVLKLIYHWACQTPAINILQWVKISSLYLKNFFTVLRAVCISWMHEQCPPLGGEMKYVEIGVITLGSTAETSRGVKNVSVEILGVFDPATKIIRMKVINSMQAVKTKDGKQDKGSQETVFEQGARAFQILWPLTHWVDKRSILLVDGIIDKALFTELGFKNIQHSGEAARSTATNMNVMNYLRNLVPKMFANTLSVLSKSIVQQFLDELSWREMYGQNVLSCYEHMLDHIGAMTKWDLKGETLITRLNKINQNPFIDWSYTKQTRRSPLNTVPLSLRNEPGIRECLRHVMKDEKKQPPPPHVYIAKAPCSVALAVVPPPPTPGQKRKIQENNILEKVNYYKEIYERATPASKIHSLQMYYYGSVRGDEISPDQLHRFPPNLKCPMCTRTFTNNGEICRHLYTHIASVTFRGSESSVCRICLKDLPVGVTMLQHINTAHIMLGFSITCRICQERFKSDQDLVIHMWDLHQRRETPYKCRICNYASSFHYHAVQHHQEKHGNAPDVLCPFCLKIFNCGSVALLKSLISHLQAHANIQRRVKKCPRCVLTFVNDMDLEFHVYEHHSQDPSVKWIPYLLPPNETNVKMTTPPPSRTPLTLSPAMPAAISAQPPTKKQKVSQIYTKKKPATLNATFAVPIDTNEKFGGSKYKIVVPEASSGHCAECGQDIRSVNHFIGRLVCTKCRYNTACQAAMDLHHEKNHSPGSKAVRAGLKTNKIQRLNENLNCKCGFSSNHPYKIANHLINCEKITVYMKPPPPEIVEETNDIRKSLPVPQQPSSQPQPPSQPDVPTSEHTALPEIPFNLLEHVPVTTFEDILSFEESMASTLEALPSLLSPSAPMPLSPLPVFESPTRTSGNNQPISDPEGESLTHREIDCLMNCPTVTPLSTLASLAKPDPHGVSDESQHMAREF